MKSLIEGKYVAIVLAHDVNDCIRCHLKCRTAMDQAKGYHLIKVILISPFDAKFERVIAWLMHTCLHTIAMFIFASMTLPLVIPNLSAMGILK